MVSRKIHDAMIFALKVLFDSALLACAIVLALILRFDLQPGAIDPKYVQILAEQVVYYIALNFLLLFKFSFYENLVETVSVNDLAKIIFSSGISSLALFVIGTITGRLFPRTVYILIWLLSIILVGGYLLFLRVAKSAIKHYSWDIKNLDRIMLVGANDNAVTVINYLSISTNMGKPVVVIDHEGDKVGKRIKNIKIAGMIPDIPKIAQRYNTNVIILCLNEDENSIRGETIKICLETGCIIKSFSAPSEALRPDDSIKPQRFRRIEYSDLLSRTEVRLDTSLCVYLQDKTVLITGGGGSIGTELCRQVCLYKPKRVVIFDIFENNAYDLQQELRSQYSDLIDICVRIGSVRDMSRLDEVFDECRPSVVFHAAAHKHVPLMEDSPGEAVKNNIFGTYNTAIASINYNVSKFILLSTDKAVNATSIMGASKRVCELIIQSLRGEKTAFAAVRFGNVLGSNGSVVPLFQKQIDAGGPVTVVHPDVTRYFMTIPEAAQLVVQAGGMAAGGEIFILEMGEPVRILDLARNMIRLSGYEPGVDIKIDFVGLRPGEKMYEELSYNTENMRRTSNKKIYMATQPNIDRDGLEEHLCKLKAVLDRNEGDYGVREALNNVLYGGREDTPIFPSSMQKAKYETMKMDYIKDIG